MEEGANASCDSPALPRNQRLEQASLLAGGGSGLVDLLIARRRGRRVHRDVRANLLHLEVGVPIPVPIEAPVAVEIVVLSKLYDVDYVPGIAGVGYTLDTCALVGVIGTAGYLKGLIYLATLAFLLGSPARYRPLGGTATINVIATIAADTINFLMFRRSLGS